MNLNIQISTNNDCSINILDKSLYPMSSSSVGQFSYADSASVVAIALNKISSTSWTDYKIVSHDKPMKTITMPINFDGWFTVKYIVLPTKDWFLRELRKLVNSSLGLYSIVYYTDGETIYKYVNQESVAVPAEEILQVNPENTTLSVVEKDSISICFLQKCYINLCQQIFESKGLTSCWNKNNVDSELIYKRDLVWMAINVIEYMTKKNQLYEAERIIELLHSCNGVCGDKKVISNGCGCSER